VGLAVIGATKTTHKRWRTRMTPLLGGLAMAVLTVRLVETGITQGLRGLIVTLVLVVVLGGPMVGGFALWERRAGRRARPGDLVATQGGVQLADLEMHARFTDVLPRTVGKRNEGAPQWWVSGTIFLSPEGLRFEPGRAAAKASFAAFTIPWADVALVQVARGPFGVGLALDLSLDGGGDVAVRVIGTKAVRAALERLR
jgi:hypothetical protein